MNEKSESKIENFEVLKKEIFRFDRKKFNFLKENSPFEKRRFAIKIMLNFVSNFFGPDDVRV